MLKVTQTNDDMSYKCIWIIGTLDIFDIDECYAIQFHLFIYLLKGSVLTKTLEFLLVPRFLIYLKLPLALNTIIRAKV